MALQAIEKEVSTFCQRLGVSTDLTVLERAWEIEIGALAKCAELVALDQTSLVIHVQSSTVMQELHLRKKELVRRMNRHFPVPWIKNLTLRMSNP